MPTSFVRGIRRPGGAAIEIELDDLQSGGGGGDFILETPDANDTATGFVRNYTAGETVAVGDPVRLNSSGQLEIADATAADLCIGVAMQNADATDLCLVLIQGIARHDAWTWTPNVPVYLGAGVLTQTAPSGAGDTIQVVGLAEHADRILVIPGFAYATHA